MDEQELLLGFVGQVRSISRRLFCVRPVLQDEAVLCEVAPDWPGSSWLAVVEEKVWMKKLILVDTVSLVLECPREILSNTFRGVPKFNFNIYVFNF